MLPREFIVSTSDVTSAVKRMIRAADRPASHEEKEEERFLCGRGWYRSVGRRLVPKGKGLPAMRA